MLLNWVCSVVDKFFRIHLRPINFLKICKSWVWAQSRRLKSYFWVDTFSESGFFNYKIRTKIIRVCTYKKRFKNHSEFDEGFVLTDLRIFCVEINLKTILFTPKLILFNQDKFRKSFTTLFFFYHTEGGGHF